MNRKLFVRAIVKFVLGVLFVPMFFAGIVMMFKNPKLLEKRLNAKEEQMEQSMVVKLSGLMFLAGFIVAGLGFRFGWYMLPRIGSVCAAIVFLIAYLLYAEVLRENAYPLLIAKRIRGEEAFLEKELDGYIAYKQKVKYRLVPFVW